MTDLQSAILAAMRAGEPYARVLDTGERVGLMAGREIGDWWLTLSNGRYVTSVTVTPDLMADPLGLDAMLVALRYELDRLEGEGLNAPT